MAITILKDPYYIDSSLSDLTTSLQKFSFGAEMGSICIENESNSAVLYYSWDGIHVKGKVTPNSSMTLNNLQDIFTSGTGRKINPSYIYLKSTENDSAFNLSAW